MFEPTRYRAYLLAICFAGGSLAASAIDMPVARFVSDSNVPGDLRKLFSVSEVFAHGTGVALLLLAVAVLDPKSRRRLPRVACSAYGAGLIAQLAKPLVPRLRPHVCDVSASVWRTFFLGGADQYAQLNSLSGRNVYSFPSGHSATAVGLAFGLTWLYPPGRWLFTFYAFLAMMQRIESGSHFVSDTFAGAAVACLAAAFCWGNGKLDRVFVSLERPNASSGAVAGGTATCHDVESAGGHHADCR